MFITNKGNVGEQPAKAASMSERLRAIIPVTETLSILSGYFYFNGVPPLMGPIAENKDLTLRILVGLDVDRMGYELAHAGDGDSAQEKFLNSLKNFAQSKMSDSEKCALSMETFLKMLDEGRLQIKKTKEPNHAKLYIFEMKKEVAKATDPIRWITDDVHKFLRREIRRERRYDAVIFDPPTFGRGANGEMYKIERDLKETIDLVKGVLSDTPLFVLFSSHTPGLSCIVAENIISQAFPSAKSVESGEMLLEGRDRPCPSGIYCRAVF